MANEFTFGMSIVLKNGTYDFSKTYANIKADQSTTIIGGEYPGTIVVATSEGSTDMTGYSFVIIQNHDPTNYVQLGFATTVYYIRLLKSSPPLLLNLEAATTLFYKANTAACNCSILGFKT